MTVERRQTYQGYDGSVHYEMSCQGVTFTVEIYATEMDGTPDWAVDIRTPPGIDWTVWPQGGRYPTLYGAIEDAERQIELVMNHHLGDR